MGVTLTDVLLFGKAQLVDVDKAKFVIYRRNILRWSALGGYLDIIVKGIPPLSLPDAVADSLQYVKAFGGTEQRNLPEGYKQLEYILSTGTGNVINTGITGFGNGDYKFEVKWRLTAEPASNYGSVFTIYTDESTNTYRIICNQKSTTTYLVNGNSISSSGSVAVYNVAANVDHIGIVASGKVNIDGTDYNTPTQGADIPSTTQLRITSSGFDGRIYYFKVYKNDVLVYNFVPCQTPSNHIGLYDTINNVFYEAATNHTPGPEVSTLTPTPTEPVDIWCNNGTLRFSNKSGLPLSYTELEYIYCDGNSYILTDILTSNTIGYKSRFKIVNRETLLFGARRTANADGFCFGYIVTNGRVYTSYGADTTGRVITVTLADDNWHTVILDDTQYLIDGEIQSFTFKGTASNFYVIALGSWNQAGTIDQRCFNGYISNFEVYDTATSSTLGKFIPAKRNSDNVIGFYDIISGTFYTNAGTGTFTGGPQVLPELYAVGTVETVSVHSTNIFNKLTDDTHEGYFVNGSVINNLATSNRTIVINCKPNTKYSFWHTAGVGGCRAFDLPTDTISVGDSATWLTPTSPTYKSANQVTTITTHSNAKKLYICAGRQEADVTRSFDDQLADFMLVEGEISTATEYVPYFDGGSATCEDLLAISSNKDEQEILSGNITRKVGVKILTGNENWAGTTVAGITYYMADILDDNMFSHLICTHFVNNAPMLADNTVYKSAGSSVLQIRYDEAADLVAFKSWLTGQYTAGTPVIVLYGLETETTESVAGQTLQVTDGDNILEITQASIDDLELEAKYQAAVSLTIQEVQDANLDPNVQVTIN